MKVFESRFAEEELEEVNSVLLSGNLGFGENVPKLEERFSVFSGKNYTMFCLLMLIVSCFLTCKTMPREEFVVLIK